MTSAQHTFLFADLAGFTALTEAHGDDEAADLADAFCRAVRDLLGEHDAREVKALGDALMLHVSEPGHAVELGLRIVSEVGGRHQFPAVRVGMHTGPAVERGGDWFGATVNLSSRVAAAASGGEVLLTEATRAAAGERDGVELRPAGQRRLKNVAQDIVLFRALREGAGDAGLPIDPVCRMAVDPARSRRVVHEGVEHHFCSDSCAEAFAAGTHRYVAARAALDLRASDDERETAVAVLRHACAEGRLTLDEFSERVDAVLASRTDAELVELTADLPDARPAERANRRRRWSVAIMGASSRRGRWRVGPKVTAVALMGGAVVDLRKAEITTPTVDVRALASMGSVVVKVPEGVRVELDGFVLGGGTELRDRGPQGPPLPGTPLIRVHAVGMFGSVVVTRGRRRRRRLRRGEDGPPRLDPGA